MVDYVKMIENENIRQEIPDFAPGDRVVVTVRVNEGGKERLQKFDGTILKRQGSGVSERFTVRRVTHGVGVEKTFILHSPRIEEIEVLRRGAVRRAKLYYLRERKGKAARIKEKR